MSVISQEYRNVLDMIKNTAHKRSMPPKCELREYTDWNF